MPLGDEQDRARARQEQTDERRRRELDRAHAEDVDAPPLHGDGRHQEARGDEARADREEGRDRLPRQLDAEVRRAPDEIDGAERDPDLGSVAHRANTAGSGAGCAGRVSNSGPWTPTRPLHAFSTRRRSRRARGVPIATTSTSSAAGWSGARRSSTTSTSARSSTMHRTWAPP